MSKTDNTRPKQTKRGKQSKKQNPPERIAKSKQLIRKKTTSPKKQALKIIKNKEELNNNSCLLPTLADLERMFEETDNDVCNLTHECPIPNYDKTVVSFEENKNSTNSTRTQCVTVETSVIDLDLYNTTSNTKLNCIVLDCDSDYLSDDISADRPRKKQKTEKTTSCDIPNVTEPQVETSNDSDVTVAYDIDIPTPGRFSPLPSTSRDNDTIFENEMRFNASLLSDELPRKVKHFTITNKLTETPIKVSKTMKGVMDLPEIVMALPKKDIVNETSVKTIVINDEDDSSIIACTSNQKNCKKLQSPMLINDCVICIDDQVPPISSPPIIDDEYNINLYNEATTISIGDIDDIIAENSHIIKKYTEKGLISITEVPPIETEVQENTNLRTNRSTTQTSIGGATISSAIEIQTSNQNISNNELVISEEVVLPQLQETNQTLLNNHNIDRSVPYAQQGTHTSTTSSTENNILPSFNRYDRHTPNRRKRRRYNAASVHPTRIENNSNNAPEIHTISTIIPTHNTSPLSVRIESNISTVRNIGDCPICLDPLSTKSICSTICGHIFCEECIKRAIRTSKRCPTCRKILKNNGFHPIFL